MRSQPAGMDRPLTGKTKYRPWLVYLIATLYGGWFLFTASSRANPLTDAISRFVPGGTAMMICASWLVLLPIGQGPFNIPSFLTLSLQILLLITLLFLPIALRFHPVATFLILAFLCAEGNWFIPKWEARWKTKHEAK